MTAACSRHRCATRLELHTRRGVVYPPTSFSAPRGLGDRASRPGASGSYGVAAHALRAHAPERRALPASAGTTSRASRASCASLSALGLVAGVNDLDDALTAAEHLTERRRLLRRGGTGSGRTQRSRASGLSDEARHPRRRPRHRGVHATRHRARARGQPASRRHRRRRPRPRARRSKSGIVALLREIAAAGTTVIFTCVDERTAAFADETVRAAPTTHR